MLELLRMRKIIKRDGRKVNFNESKIYNAINDAFDACEKSNPAMVEKITDEVVSTIDKKFCDEVPYVEDVQDLIEKTLIKHNQADVAKAYILYRHERTRAREIRTENFKKINSYLFNTDLNEFRLNISKYTSKMYFLDLLSKDAIKYVSEYDLYIKNVDSYILGFEEDEINLANYEKTLSKFKNLSEMNVFLFHLINDLTKEISYKIHIINFEIYLKFLGKFCANKEDFNRKLNTFLKFIDELVTLKIKLELYVDKINQADLDLLFDAFKNNNFSNLKLNVKYNKSINSILNKNIYFRQLFNIYNLDISRNVSFSYFINLNHLTINYKNEIDNLVNVIKENTLERFNAIEANKIKLESLKLNHNVKNIEDLRTIFNIDISFIGLYEFIQSGVASKNDLLNYLLNKVDEIKKETSLNFRVVSKIDLNCRNLFLNEDKKNLKVQQNYIYSSGNYFPTIINATLDEKLEYESSNLLSLDGSMILLNPNDFADGNYSNLINKINEHLTNYVIVFIDENENYGDKLPLDKIFNIYANSELFISESFLAKTHEIENK